MKSPVLILGAGINGCALARELISNDVPVVLVDKGDLAGGATAKSSRLIHGGLRYLEYGEFDLVRESVAERARLLRVAADFVRPMRFFIPLTNRARGLGGAARRFVGMNSSPARDRGLWLTRLGLRLYDAYARERRFAQSAIHPIDDESAPAVDATRYRHLCSYNDAQMLYPERFVVALLKDAARIARERGIAFEVFTYHTARRDGVDFEVVRDEHCVARIAPSVLVNATGAWGDRTLRALQIESPTLFAGTKGSHLFTTSAQLRAALRGNAVYAEADDGRPVFVLPFGNSVCVGTTDEPFADAPDEAVATEAEIDYLLRAVNRVFPSVGLRRAGVFMHTCGVRPLPCANVSAPAAVTRRHRIECADGAVPTFTLIGGKLTTCLTFAEQGASRVLQRLGLPHARSASDRVLTDDEHDESPGSFGDAVEAVIAREWVTHLDDLVERRLMLLYDEHLSSDSLRHLARALVAAGKLARDEVESQIAATRERLRRYYGRSV